MRINSINYLKEVRSPLLEVALVGQFFVPAAESCSKEENRCCLYSRHFQVVRELCPETVFTLSEP